jgi:hypothetical protein
VQIPCRFIQKRACRGAALLLSKAAVTQLGNQLRRFIAFGTTLKVIKRENNLAIFSNIPADLLSTSGSMVLLRATISGCKSHKSS